MIGECEAFCPLHYRTEYKGIQYFYYIHGIELWARFNTPLAPKGETFDLKPWHVGLGANQPPNINSTYNKPNKTHHHGSRDVFLKIEFEILLNFE